jgi:hypothetical protein
MAGPRLGPRPPDFDEDHVQRSPTFCKWLALSPGSNLVYACRTFTKGGVDEEERLMRRIMIAHRNNLKEHAVLRRAIREADAASGVGQVATEEEEKSSPRRRRATGAMAGKAEGDDGGGTTIATATSAHPTATLHPPANDGIAPSGASSGGKRPRRTYCSIPPRSDEAVLGEMDVAAVEMTRSYRRWSELPDGTSFSYNQTYVKGTDGHDWLLRKNIWRRMRYRRENRAKVLNLIARGGGVGGGDEGGGCGGATNVDGARGGQQNDEDTEDSDNDRHHRLLVVSRAVEDAAAAAAAFSARADTFDHSIDADAVAALGAQGGEDDPTVVLSGALDAAARLAAAVSVADGSIGGDSNKKDEGMSLEIFEV